LIKTFFLPLFVAAFTTISTSLSASPQDRFLFCGDNQHKNLSASPQDRLGVACARFCLPSVINLKAAVPQDFTASNYSLLFYYRKQVRL
jgi:hypothetical protein